MILAQGTLAYSLTSVMGAIPAEMDAMCCGEPVRHPTQKSRVGLTPGNPHAFPRIRIWRGRRVLAVQHRLAQQIIGEILQRSVLVSADERAHRCCVVRSFAGGVSYWPPVQLRLALYGAGARRAL